MNTQGIQSPSSGRSDRPNLPETLITKPLNGKGHTYSSVQGTPLEIVSSRLALPSQKVLNELPDSLGSMQEKELPDGKLSIPPDGSDDFEDCSFETCDHTTNPFDHLNQEIAKESSIEKQFTEAKAANTEAKAANTEAKAANTEAKAANTEVKAANTEVKASKEVESTIVLTGLQELESKHFNLIFKENQLIIQKPSLVNQLIADKIDPQILLPELDAIAARKELLRLIFSQELVTRNDKPLSQEEVEDILDKFASSYHDFYQNTILPFLQKNEQSEDIDQGNKNKGRGSPLKAPPEVIPEYAPKTKTIKDEENLLGPKVLMKNIASSLAIEDDDRRAREKQKAAQEDQSEQQVKADRLVHDRNKKDFEKQDIKSKSEKENESKTSINKEQVQKTQINRGRKEKRKVSNDPDAPPVDVIDYTKEKRPS